MAGSRKLPGQRTGNKAGPRSLCGKHGLGCVRWAPEALRDQNQRLSPDWVLGCHIPLMRCVRDRGRLSGCRSVTSCVGACMSEAAQRRSSLCVEARGGSARLPGCARATVKTCMYKLAHRDITHGRRCGWVVPQDAAVAGTRRPLCQRSLCASAGACIRWRVRTRIHRRAAAARVRRARAGCATPRRKLSRACPSPPQSHAPSCPRALASCYRRTLASWGGRRPPRAAARPRLRPPPPSPRPLPPPHRR